MITRGKRWHSSENNDADLLLETELATWREQTQPESSQVSSRLARQLKERNDLFRLNRLYFDMMWAQLEWAEYERAVETCDAGVRLSKEIGIPPVQYPTLKALALLQLGRYGEALESLRLEVVDSEHPFGQAMQLYGFAYYYLELQLLDEALRTCRDLQRRATQLRRAWMDRRASALITHILTSRGDLDSQSREEIQSEVRRLGERIPREVTVEVLLADGKPEAALREATTLTGEARVRGSTARLLDSLELQARALLYLRRPSDSIGLLQEGCQLAHERNALPMEWRLLALKGRALQASGEASGARQALSEAASIIRRVGDSIRDPQEKARFFASAQVASVLGASA